MRLQLTAMVWGRKKRQRESESEREGGSTRYANETEREGGWWEEERKEGSECFCACTYQQSRLAEECSILSPGDNVASRIRVSSPPPESVCVCVCVCLRCVCFFSLGIAFVFRCANGAKCHRMKFHARLHGNSDSVCHASPPYFTTPHASSQCAHI